ncbi:site-specific DNA-methyltransferase [Desulfobacter postgatei]|uniref:site-specific DNA-methyltransferase (adenine-specific) n=1 Tax=Desulfobacter postgatei 2ac9 TaxID=879212 RepID=I5B0E9_9BACT|nr:site-specific DNA-methyltransferase [Desulfobacter postgatei]EIM62962.1 adenine specific DNA methylase Mod [Desulfobacter postgatei 2ac9]
MEKMDGKTMDIVAENVGKLKELFPEAFTEGKVDFDALKEVLGTFVDDRDERYSFTWNGKSKARMIAQTPSTGTLRPCKEESVDWDTTQNIFIEGDNLEVLKLLQKSYHKKMKMIYIDPPYNTGKDFVYKDNFKDNIKNYKEITGQVDGEGRNLSNNPETSGRYHTDWLNMMYPRLKLARNLLKDDGVIFISIDDSEASNLIKICDEVFGEENFIADLIWQKKFSRANDASYFSTMHDHILCYAKRTKLNNNGDSWELKLLPRGDEIPDGYTNPDDDHRGPWTSVVLSAKSGTEKLIYEITTPSGRKCLPPDGRFWGVNRDRFSELVEDNRIWFGKDGSGIPRLKTFLSEVQDGLRPNTIWFHQEVGHNQEGRQEVKKLFDDKGYFDGPKPVRLLDRIIQISNLSSSDIVLDFFAGSATTGHAVVNHNACNETSFKYILVQLPEVCDEKSEAFKAGYKTIAEISKERIRRAGAKIKEENPEYEGDLGFKVFKLDATNIKPWEVDFDLTERTLEDYISNIKTDRREEDVLYEVLLKYGLDLTLPIDEWIMDNGKLIMKDEHHSQLSTVNSQLVYSIGMGALIICLSDAISLEVVEGIAELKDELNPEIMRVVFKDSGFKDDVVKTNAVQILKQAGIVDVRSL